MSLKRKQRKLINKKYCTKFCSFLNRLVSCQSRNVISGINIGKVLLELR